MHRAWAVEDSFFPSWPQSTCPLHPSFESSFPSRKSFYFLQITVHNAHVQQITMQMQCIMHMCRPHFPRPWRLRHVGKHQEIRKLQKLLILLLAQSWQSKFFIKVLPKLLVSLYFDEHDSTSGNSEAIDCSEIVGNVAYARILIWALHTRILILGAVKEKSWPSNGISHFARPPYFLKRHILGFWILARWLSLVNSFRMRNKVSCYWGRSKSYWKKSVLLYFYNVDHGDDWSCRQFLITTKLIEVLILSPQDPQDSLRSHVAPKTVSCHLVSLSSNTGW